MIYILDYYKQTTPVGLESMTASRIVPCEANVYEP